MNSLADLARTIHQEVEAIGGNHHPMPVSVTHEQVKGQMLWAVCLSVRNDRHEFTCESEHEDLPTAVKNAMKGIRREVGDILRRGVQPRQNVKIGGPKPDHPVSWHPQDNPGLGFQRMVTGEYHSTDKIRQEGGDIGTNIMAIVESYNDGD